MMDDLRNHDSTPSAQERAWMSVDPLAALLRLVVLASLAVAIGIAASHMTGPPPGDAVVASQH